MRAWGSRQGPQCPDLWRGPRRVSYNPAMLRARPAWAAEAVAMARRRPLALLAAGVVAGIAAAFRSDLWPAFLAVGVLAGAALLRYRHPALPFLVGVALGGLRQEWAERRGVEPLREAIEGVVSGPPRVYRTLEDPDAGPLADGSFVMGRTQVRYFARQVLLVGGERVAVTGPARRPRHATNPGDHDPILSHHPDGSEAPSYPVAKG